MFSLGVLSQQLSVPPEPEWDLVLDMRFNGNFSDSAGRHSPVSYGAVISGMQSVEGGSSFYANQDGRVFTDDYNGDHQDFDFSGKDFKIVCWIRPISIDNDYVWGKSSGGNLGANLKLGLSGGQPVVYMWPMTADIGVIVPDLLSGKWTKTEVNRIGDIWSLLIDDVVVSSGISNVNIASWDSGAGYKGFLIGGAFNSNRYSGWIDVFSVYTRQQA